MGNIDFGNKASSYEKSALVQKPLPRCCLSSYPSKMVKRYLIWGVDQVISLSSNGFQVLHCELEQEITRCTPDSVYKVFQSGAENGYLNQAFYPVKLSETYVETFRSLVKEVTAEQANPDGMVELKFTRIYLVAGKNI